VTDRRAVDVLRGFTLAVHDRVYAMDRKRIYIKL
jgi:hypothetical protein